MITKIGVKDKQQAPVHRFSFTVGQVILLTVLLGFGLPLLISTVEVAPFGTAFIFLLVLFAGLALCNATQIKLGEPKLRLLGTFWLIKIGVTILLLYVFWIPLLETSDARFGFDPLRFFYDAHDLIENDWNPLAGSNYQGIIYYYGAIFYLFGHNPIIPALINGFVMLLAILYLIRIAYELKGERGPHDWVLAFLLLIPEILLYDVMTSRETLMAVLILVTSVAAGRYLVHSFRVSLSSTLLLVGVCLSAILAVRTSMSIPVVGAIVLMGVILRPRISVGLSGKLLMLALGIGLIAAGPWVQEMAGGTNFDYLRTLQGLQSIESNVASISDGWSENSIGLLLAPSNTWTAIIFTLPRMLLYLAAPLPKIMVDNFVDFMMILTSVLNLLAMPYVMAGFALAWRKRSATLVLHLAFWVTFIAIAGGNIIIHERYRVMATLLLFTCAWLGYTTCSRKQVRQFASLWYGLLAVGAMFYIIYKIHGSL